jgi:hypothetical protein
MSVCSDEMGMVINQTYVRLQLCQYLDKSTRKKVSIWKEKSEGKLVVKRPAAARQVTQAALLRLVREYQKRA